MTINNHIISIITIPVMAVTNGIVIISIIL